MALRFVSNNEHLIDYGSLRTLVVDDIPGMRSALKMTLANFGITRTDVASTAQEAIFRLGNGPYDLILADYNLGEARDGQQLLEELRHRGLITLQTVYVMVTAEAMYERVAATAELAPDDYLLKPFNGEVLRNRLEVIFQRKLAFSEAHRRFAEGDLEGAVAACDSLMRNKPRYLVDALRFKGELLNAMGRFEEGEALYRLVIEMRAVPWARLGLARVLHALGRAQEAEAILLDALAAAPEMMAAYDLLAEVRIARKDLVGAQQSLQEGAAISGKTVRRQQQLGELAYENGDLETARTAFQAALDKGRHSIFVSPADYGNLCRVQVEQGNLNGALDTLKKNKDSLQLAPEGQLVTAVIQSMVHSRSGQADLARRALDEAGRLRGEGVHGDGRLMLDLADSCMTQGRNEESDAIIGEVAKNAHDSEALLSKAREIYARCGRAADGEELLKKATADVRKLNNEGVYLAQKGDFDGAVSRLLTAAKEAPYNPRILMNAAWVLLRDADQNGLKEGGLQEAKRLLDEVERLAPGHSRLPGLRSQVREIEARYGISRRPHP
ncbi:MAG: response regulator [Gallionellaceae bacterium]|nr:response regulator [Gallionellaceae bacterium]